jgi:hypothetical protein
VPIETPEASRPSIEALQAVLPALVGSAGIRQSAPNFAASLLASPRSLSSPGLSYPVYALGLADVASGGGVAKAKLSAWRHEFTSEGRSSRQRSRPAAARNSPGSTSIRGFARSSASCARPPKPARTLPTDPMSRGLVQISALGVRALWLKSKSRSHADIVIPLAPTRRELTANRHYSPAELIEALKSAAETLLRADAPGKGA